MELTAVIVTPANTGTAVVLASVRPVIGYGERGVASASGRRSVARAELAGGVPAQSAVDER